MNDRANKPGVVDIGQYQLLTVSEVATYLRVSRTTVWRWCKQGILPAVQIGRHWRIPANSLAELVDLKV